MTGKRFLAVASGGPMRAVQVSSFGKPVTLAEVTEPEITDPGDVIVRIAGAGICRTDLHVVQGELAGDFQHTLPLPVVHEKSDWQHDSGAAVPHFAVGLLLIVHPAVPGGPCLAC